MAGLGAKDSESPLPARLTVLPSRGFVGREQELAHLRTAVSAALAGTGPRVALVAGEPGAGKTALLAEVAREAHARGAAVAYGRGEEGLELPFGVWRQALGRTAWPSGLRRRHELLDAVVEHLATAVRAAPLVLVVDDLQWADRASLLLLSHVVAIRPTPRLAVLAGYRSTEVAPGGPLARWLAAVAREPGVADVVLPPLALDDVEALLAATYTGPDAAVQSAARLRDQSGGNAFFLTALLDDHERRDAAAGLPSATLQQVIDERVARVGPGADAVLRAASVVGEMFDVDVVAAASGVDAAAVLGVLERGIRHRLVAETTDGTAFTFVHALVGDALRARVTRARRRELHRAAAHALDAAGAPAAVVAGHLAAADPEDRPGREAAVDAALRAGIGALEELAYEDAVARLTDALSLIDHWGLDDDRRCTAMLALGRAQRRATKAEEATATLTEAIALATELGRWDDVSRAAFYFPFVPSMQPDPETVAMAEAAIGAAPEGTPASALLRSFLAWLLHYSDKERCIALAESAVAIADSTGDRAIRGFCRGLLLLARLGVADPGSQLELAESALALMSPGDEFAVEFEFGVRQRMVHELMRIGDLPRLDQEIGQIQRLDDRYRRQEIRWALLTWRATRALLVGHLDVAETLASQAFSVNSGSGDFVNRAALQLQLGIASYLRGRLGDIADVAAVLAQEFPHAAPRCVVIAALVSAGRETEARAQLAALAAGGFADLPRDDMSAGAAVLLADACRVLGAEREAAALHDWLLPQAGHAAVFVALSAACLGAVDRALGQLALTCGRNAAAGQYLESAARLEARMGARPWLALTRVEQAALGVAGAAEEARSIAEDLGVGLVLQRLAALEQPQPPPADHAELRAEGDMWTVTYAGRTVRLKGLRGFEYLRELLRWPGQELHVVELQGGPAGAGTPVLDEQAKAAYRRRLDDLEAELEEAEAFGDAERAARAAEARQALAEELARAVGLGGRDRTLGSDAERARVNVSRAIRAAMARISEHHPELGRHLELAVRTGTYCAYEPDPSLALEWKL